jgi:adenylosuccinate lyase
MSNVWSEEAKLERWLAVELAALDAWAQVGVVPATAAGDVRSGSVKRCASAVGEGSMAVMFVHAHLARAAA